MVPHAGAASQDLPQVYNLREVADDVRDMAAISELTERPPGDTPFPGSLVPDVYM